MSPKSVAIIDDEIDLVYVFRAALEMDGFKVCTFTDPIEAIDKLKNKIDDYGLVISDYRMPRMNGFELCTKLINLNPKLKVIIMSAYDSVEYDTSRFTFIHKPISIGRLSEIVKENLAK